MCWPILFEYFLNSHAMKQEESEFDAQLSRLLEKEKVARVNNEHFTSVLILKDIVGAQSRRSVSATRHNSGNASTNRSTSS